MVGDADSFCFGDADNFKLGDADNFQLGDGGADKNLDYEKVRSCPYVFVGS